MMHQTKCKKKVNIRSFTALALAFLTLFASLWFDDIFTPTRVVAAQGDGLSDHVIDTVSPSHVQFNLFDYWLVEQDSTTTSGTDYQQSGINEGHSYIFGGVQGAGIWNFWTGNRNHYSAQGHPDAIGIRYGEYSGIVKETLADGYPVLDLMDEPYYPDPCPDWLAQNREESLAYLFDPDIQNEYKAVYENVQGLVKYNGNGGYVYNSHENYASFQSAPGTLGTNGEPSAGYFDVYDNWALTSGGSPNGQFFPFDGAEEVFQKNDDGIYKVEEGRLVPKMDVPLENTNGNTTPLNHYIGMTMETIFLQPQDGKIDDTTPMYFTFSGDDDVWIFIDNILVSDLGGVHDECFTIIDFEEGMVYTGLTPMVINEADGTFSEDIPTLAELRNAEAGNDTEQWTWYDRTPKNEDRPEEGRKGTTSGDYAQFKQAHGIQTRTLKGIFEAAGQDQYQTWGDGTANGMNANTFDQNTQHELKMFYLERGAGASNLVLEFNMLAVPASGITKTDQDGRPVSGAEFELWPAQVSTETDAYGLPLPLIDEQTGLYIADTSSGTPICKATTDENGHLNFITDKRKIISFQELAQNAENPQLYYVLKETQRPAGYRSKGDISLYYSIYNHASRDGVLLSHNYWQTGAYTQAVLDVTMTDTLYTYAYDGQNDTATVGEPIVPAGENATEYLDNGIIFAVPIKRMDMSGSLYDESNFHALYGTTNTGWTLMTENITDRESVLKAARGMEDVMQQTRQTGTIIAERNARQQFHVEVTNIPGDVKRTYPYLLGTSDEAKSEYNIAFYFAPNAGSLDEVDANEIVRISTIAPTGANGEAERFERQYASQFYVSNTFNRVRVQKLDYRGNRLAGAQFSMYQAYSTWPRAGYALVPQGSADTAHVGMYRNPLVVDENGVRRSREEILSGATTWDVGTTMSEGSIAAAGLDLDGAVIFPTKFDAFLYQDETSSYKVDPADTSTYMEAGEYVIFETDTPDGYTINPEPITVTIDDDGVFADAGQVNDGIRVGQYAGWILNSMSQFATESAVDETLTFVNSTLQVQGEDGTLKAPVEGEISWLNKYSNENNRYIFFAEDMGYYVTAGRNLYQFTEEGTPQLVLQQNTAVQAKVLILDGDYENYSGLVRVNKRNADQTTYTLDGIATDGTLAFWLQKATDDAGAQTLQSVQIAGKTLEEGKDYHVYTPNVTDLSQYDDLSGLFSIETLVQVYNQNVGDLEVSKETAHVAEGSEAEDAIFYYRVYGVYEQATEIVLARDDGTGHALTTPDGQPVLDTTFTGSLNVRLRENVPQASDQATASNVVVDFTNGVGRLYLEPEYEVEYVYIPQNEEHAAHGLVGLVDTQITLADAKTLSGTGTVAVDHLSASGAGHSHMHDVQFENGVGHFYRNPDFAVQSVQIGGRTFEADDLTATSRFHYATIQQILNMNTTAEVPVTFTDTDSGTPSAPERVVVKDATGPGQNVTVKSDGNDGYCMAYSLDSDTHSQAVVAQFALRAGQRIHISGLGGGTVYYVYEYAVDREGTADKPALADDWTTEIAIQAQGAQNGTEPITDRNEAVIMDYLPQFRAAMGTIRTNATQKVAFTNAARVGSLTLSKMVTGDRAPSDDTFRFKITLTDESGKALAGSYSYTGAVLPGADASKPQNGVLALDANGVGSITLSAGQSVTIADLPVGTKWIVEEETKTYYTASVALTDGANGTVQVNGSVAQGEIGAQDETDTAAFANAYKAPVLGTLRVNKSVEGEGADPDRTFAFRAVIDGQEETFALKAGESKTFSDLPVGTVYTVTEEVSGSDEGYTAKVLQISGTIQGDQEVTLPFVNVYANSTPQLDTGSLTVTKHVDGNGADANQSFGFAVTFTDGEGNESTQTFRLLAGETQTFSQIPAGVRYTVRETDAGGYLQDMESISGTIVAESTVALSFTNHAPAAVEEPATLIISKQLAGNYPKEDANKQFYFTLTVDGVSHRFSLKAGEEKEWQIAAGASYELREDDYAQDGYSVSIVRGSGTAQSGQSIEVVATNTFDGTGVETVIAGEKTWDLNGADKTALPDSITIYLMAGGQVVDEQEVFPDSQGAWNYALCAPKYDAQGNSIQYEIREEPVTGFHASYEGYNIRNTRVAPAVVALPVVHKQVEGQGAPAETFAFLLQAQGGAPMPEGAEGSRMTVNRSGSGEVSFGTISFSETGRYVYTITETNGAKTGWQYDNATYLFTVTVSQQDGQLHASTALTKAGSATDRVVFTNRWHETAYEQPTPSLPQDDIGGNGPDNEGENGEGAQTPQTGETSHASLPLVLMVAVAIVMAGIAIFYRRKTSDR